MKFSDILATLAFVLGIGVLATAPFWAETVDLVGFECDEVQECE